MLNRGWAPARTDPARESQHTPTEQVPALGCGSGRPAAAFVGAGRHQRHPGDAAQAHGLAMRRHPHRHGIVSTSQESRATPRGRHQPGMRSWPGLTHAVPERGGKAGDIRRQLTDIGRNHDDTLGSAAVLQRENPPDGTWITWIAAEPIAGFGRIGDDAAALQVSTNARGLDQNAYPLMARQPMSRRIWLPSKWMPSAIW